MAKSKKQKSPSSSRARSLKSAKEHAEGIHYHLAGIHGVVGLIAELSYGNRLVVSPDNLQRASQFLSDELEAAVDGVRTIILDLSDPKELKPAAEEEKEDAVKQVHAEMPASM